MNFYLPSIIFIGAFLFYAINGCSNLKRYLNMKACCIKTYGKIIGYHKFDELKLKNAPKDFNKKYHYDIEIETQNGKSVCLYEEAMPRLKSRRKNIGDEVLLLFSDEYHFCCDYKIAKFDSWFYLLSAVLMAIIEVLFLLVANNFFAFSFPALFILIPAYILMAIFIIISVILS